MNIDTFYNSHVNRAWDKYGREQSGYTVQWYEPFGGQCVSLIKAYLIALFGERVKDAYGNAIDYWNGRSWNGILELCDAVSYPLQDGDIVISDGVPTYGHIWIYYKGQALSQNVLEDPRARLYPIRLQGGIIGILRPKKTVTETKPAPIQKQADRSLYRLYNPSNGDHLYTQSHSEAQACQNGGWKYEDVAWVAPEKGDLVYRLCNPYNGIHHFTASAVESADLQKLGWKLEGGAFRSGGSRPIYRMYNPHGGQHVLTAQKSEHDGLVKAGWVCEGQPIRY